MKKSRNMLPTWDLEAIYPDTDAWEKDFAKLKGLAEAFAAYRGKLGGSAKTLAAAETQMGKAVKLLKKPDKTYYEHYADILEKVNQPEKAAEYRNKAKSIKDEE